MASAPRMIRTQNAQQGCKHTSLTVTWDPPLYGANTNTIRYRIQIESSTQNTTDTSTFWNLNNGQQYMVTISASNCFGSGHPGSETFTTSELYCMNVHMCRHHGRTWGNIMIRQHTNYIVNANASEHM